MFTIPCGNRVALAQYETTGKSWRTDGDWLRVFPNLIPEAPSDPCAVVAAGGGWLERGFIANWTRAGDIVWLTHCPPPQLEEGDIACKGAPAFQDEHGAVPVMPWVVFDGETEWWYESLPPEYDALPSFALRDGRSLGLRLQEGWRPEDEVARFGRTVVLAADDWQHLDETYGLVRHGESGSISAVRP